MSNRTIAYDLQIMSVKEEIKNPHKKEFTPIAWLRSKLSKYVKEGADGNLKMMF